MLNIQVAQGRFLSLLILTSFAPSPFFLLFFLPCVFVVYRIHTEFDAQSYQYGYGQTYYSQLRRWSRRMHLGTHMHTEFDTHLWVRVRSNVLSTALSVQACTHRRTHTHISIHPHASPHSSSARILTTVVYMYTQLVCVKLWVYVCAYVYMPGTTAWLPITRLTV